MKSICLCFQVHQPYRLRTFRFFNIGEDHQYYDDYQNRHIIRRIAERSYIPANNLLMAMIREYGKSFKVSFAISGPALEQLSQHAPEVIRGFKELAATGCVEFLAETWSHSLASLKSKDEFVRQVNKHRDAIREYFGQTPKTFVNTELIYSDFIGQDVHEMGFSTLITEGAKHILGWKSPNFVYCNNINPKLKVLLRNFRLSDDVSFRFSDKSWSEWPLTAEKYVHWLNEFKPDEEVVNMVLNYDTIGSQHTADSGIFDFVRHLPEAVFKNSKFGFSTPAEASKKFQTVASISVPHPISWADEEKDLTAWIGNELQDEAFSKIYAAGPAVLASGNEELIRDWERLQNSDHFYYMCTKWFSDGDVHRYFNPYPSPYEAFINYMNVVSDFLIRLDQATHGMEISQNEKAETTPPYISPKIKLSLKTIKKTKTMAKTTKPAAKKPAAKKPAVKKAAAKKPAVKKAVAKNPAAKKAAPKKKVVAKKAAPKKKVVAKKPAVKKAVKK